MLEGTVLEGAVLEGTPRLPAGPRSGDRLPDARVWRRE
jgi:hypothetical protein